MNEENERQRIGTRSAVCVCVCVCVASLTVYVCLNSHQLQILQAPYSPFTGGSHCGSTL